MVDANLKDRANTFRVAFLTLASIFIMGYLNAMSLNSNDMGVMISAQSGNIVWLGIHIATGQWALLLRNILLFAGFAGGAFFALHTQSLFRNKYGQFYWNWTFFAIPIMLYPILFQYNIPAGFSLFILGFSAGATLGFFRKLYHLDINTSMATGSARFVGLSLGEVFKKGADKKKSFVNFWLFLLAVLMFSFGAFIYIIFGQIDTNLANGGLDLNLTLGASAGYYERIALTYGADLNPSSITNVVRVLGLVFFCLVPYLFCPRYKNYK